MHAQPTTTVCGALEQQIQFCTQSSSPAVRLTQSRIGPVSQKQDEGAERKTERKRKKEEKKEKEEAEKKRRKEEEEALQGGPEREMALLRLQMGFF